CEPVELDMTPKLDAEDILTDPDALRGLRLLVVDDDPANRELVRLIVEPFGVQVTEPGSGSQAVSAARADPFDMILMDIRMPEIDGPTTANIIRSKPGRNASTPMIAFTADLVGGMPATWTPMFDGMLAKPIVPTDLVLLLATRRPGGARQRSITLPT
ncbi:MAG TPA: response regulator, partial [Phenylobacterium sp.]|nr:response regulator [Phenylobacterium sp.]